jgi:hypothetical protein
MSKLTDQLKSPRLRNTVKGDVPEWWPAAQIVGAVVVGVGLLVASIAHFGKSEVASPVTTIPYSAITAAPVTTPSDGAPTTDPSSVTPPASSTPTGSAPPGSTPPESGSMPTPVDAVTVAVQSSQDTTKAIPLAAWLAARDNTQLIYPNSTATAVKLTQSSGTSHTFAITISNGQEAFDVQVTSVLQSNGIWAAS